MMWIVDSRLIFESLVAIMFNAASRAEKKRTTPGVPERFRKTRKKNAWKNSRTRQSSLNGGLSEVGKS